VVIASSDKDFMQLVSGESESAAGKIGLLNPNDKSETVWAAAQVRAKAGVAPEQIVDWLSLMGDSVDNIPGVPGVGPKTATELLRQFGSVAEMYGRLDEVKSDRLRAALRVAELDVRRNQGLVRLQDDLDCDVAGLAQLAVKPANVGQLGGLYRGWGFRSLLAEVEAAEARQQTLI
jgi:DNA polymerase-1